MCTTETQLHARYKCGKPLAHERLFYVVTILVIHKKFKNVTNEHEKFDEADLFHIQTVITQLISNNIKINIKHTAKTNDGGWFPFGRINMYKNNNILC